MNQSTIQKLLGRTLSANESTNFDLYLNLTKQRLETLLGIYIGDGSEKTRVYTGRMGYTILYVDPFTSLTTVTIDGDSQDVTTQQWDNLNGDWKNAIVFSKCLESKSISVTASFGYGSCMPLDLQLLFARAFDLVTREQLGDDMRIKSKQNEDFRVTYADNVTSWDAFKIDNKSTIRNYSQKGLGQIQSGDWKQSPHRSGRIVE